MASSLDSKQFRRALGSFTTGVTIVTTRDAAGHDVGLTANSFNSVSLDPPMVLWSISRQSKSLAAFMEAEHFAVHVLSSGQDQLANLFATRGADKFAELKLSRGYGDVPLLEDCSARFQCRSTLKHEGGDHVILVGEVIAFDQWDRLPLVFHGGGYAIAARKPQPAATDAALDPESTFGGDYLIYLLGRAHHQLLLRLRRALEAHGLAESEWYVLNLLSVTEGRSVADLDEQLAYTGSSVTYDQLAGLAAAGFVRLTGSYDPSAIVSLTEAGRRAVIELVAAAKAIESDAEGEFGFDETQLLKQWLRSIIRASDPGSPSLWRNLRE